MEHSVKLSIKNLGGGKRHKNKQITDGQTQKQTVTLQHSTAGTTVAALASPQVRESRHYPGVKVPYCISRSAKQ